MHRNPNTYTSKDDAKGCENTLYGANRKERRINGLKRAREDSNASCGWHLPFALTTCRLTPFRLRHLGRSDPSGLQQIHLRLCCSCGQFGSIMLHQYKKLNCNAIRDLWQLRAVPRLPGVLHCNLPSKTSKTNRTETPSIPGTPTPLPSAARPSETDRCRSSLIDLTSKKQNRRNFQGCNLRRMGCTVAMQISNYNAPNKITSNCAGPHCPPTATYTTKNNTPKKVRIPGRLALTYYLTRMPAPPMGREGEGGRRCTLN